MSTRIPLGERESSRLEFKAAAALRKPLSISREIVAMLNARSRSTGEVWIGLSETDGVATRVEGVEDAEQARVDLLNHLIEAVEPRIRVPGDLEIRTVSDGSRDVLLVEVKHSDRGPFAQLKEGGRHYMIRVDHRLRPMTREEIFEGEREPESTDLPDLREKIYSRGMAGLWVALEPVPHLEIDIQDREVLFPYLLDPRKSGNRESGWNFRYPPVLGIAPRLHQGRLELGTDASRRTTIWRSGSIEFWTTLEGLHHRTDSIQEIYPLALLEYSVSIARLAASLYADSKVTPSPPEDVLVDAVLIRARGWHLPSYPPSTYGYHLKHSEPEDLEDDFALPSPLRYDWMGFRGHPDEAGFAIVRSIYEKFHLPEDRIPNEFDRKSRRLQLTD